MLFYSTVPQTTTVCPVHFLDNLFYVPFLDNLFSVHFLDNLFSVDFLDNLFSVDSLDNVFSVYFLDKAEFVSSAAPYYLPCRTSTWSPVWWRPTWGSGRTTSAAVFGVSERTDGLKYEGEWYNNKKYGYGVTTFKVRLESLLSRWDFNSICHKKVDARLMLLLLASPK